MNKPNKIEGTTEAWEDGTLGCDAEFAKVSDLTIETVAKAAGLKSISIRMQPELLEELKMIADIHGLGYQPLIKQVLRRFVDAETKTLLREAHASLENNKTEEAEETGHALDKCG